MLYGLTGNDVITCEQGDKYFVLKTHPLGTAYSPTETRFYPNPKRRRTNVVNEGLFCLRPAPILMSLVGVDWGVIGRVVRVKTLSITRQDEDP